MEERMIWYVRFVNLKFADNAFLLFREFGKIFAPPSARGTVVECVKPRRADSIQSCR
jgi:hypothetical protein